MMHSFQDLPILSCWGCPSPSSSRLSRPLLGIPGQNRPGDLHLVSPEPLLPTPPHPMILLQVGDHRLDARSGGEQPLEQSSIFVGCLGLAFSGDRDLRDPGEVRGVFVSCEPIPDPPQGPQEDLPSPSPTPSGNRTALVIPVVGVRGMGHPHSVVRDRQGHLDPVLMAFVRLVLRDAGDLRLMNDEGLQL